MSEAPSPFNANLLKRSIRLAGHPTSLSLEPEFWDMLEAAAEAEDEALSTLLNRIDSQRSGPLASAVRVFVVRRLLEEVEHLRERA